MHRKRASVSARWQTTYKRAILTRTTWVESLMASRQFDRGEIEEGLQTSGETSGHNNTADWHNGGHDTKQNFKRPPSCNKMKYMCYWFPFCFLFPPYTQTPLHCATFMCSFAWNITHEDLCGLHGFFTLLDGGCLPVWSLVLFDSRGQMYIFLSPLFHARRLAMFSTMLRGDDYNLHARETGSLYETRGWVIWTRGSNMIAWLANG